MGVSEEGISLSCISFVQLHNLALGHVIVLHQYYYFISKKKGRKNDGDFYSYVCVIISMLYGVIHVH